MLDVAIGGARRHRNLTVFPLVASGATDLPYDLLVDAVAAGAVRIGEAAEATVPTLVAKNAADRDVLVLDGEQLIGALQNRMTNRSILLPAHSVTDIPVYCMEQGRWRFESDTMQTAPQHSPAKVRRRARETEARHAAADVASHQVLREAQGAVWDDVADTLRVFDASSATGSLDAAYTANDSGMAGWLAAFPREDAQVGLLAFTGDAPLGMDLIGAPRLWARLHERLLRGYVLDALEHAHRTREGGAGESGAGEDGPAAADGQRFLDTVRTATRTDAPSVGRGTYRVLGGDVVGGELVDGERIAHLSAFPARRTPGGGAGVVLDDAPVARPSRRRRNR